jgi:predicted phosphodiesterase
MTTAFISDIHGNYEALKAVLAEIDRMRVTEIVCVGDVVGYYSQVNECCDELKRRGIPSVLGNHDWYLGFGGFCTRSRSVNECLVYQRKVITSENVNWLRAFHLQMQIGNAQVVHAGWGDPIDEYLTSPNEDYFARLSGVNFVSGHTHVLQSGVRRAATRRRSTGGIRNVRRRDLRAASGRIRHAEGLRADGDRGIPRLLLWRAEDRREKSQTARRLSIEISTSCSLQINIKTGLRLAL